MSKAFNKLASLHTFPDFVLMKKFILIISFILFLFQSGWAEGEFSPPKGKIKGSVADATSKEPLEYATVALYSAGENKLITGTVTDYMGHFKRI